MGGSKIYGWDRGRPHLLLILVRMNTATLKIANHENNTSEIFKGHRSHSVFDWSYLLGVGDIWSDQ